MKRKKNNTFSLTVLHWRPTPAGYGPLVIVGAACGVIDTVGAVLVKPISICPIFDVLFVDDQPKLIGVILSVIELVKIENLRIPKPPL